MDNQMLTQLFAAMRSGDTDAFAALYEACKKPVYTVLWRMVSSRELAEDLTHDLFVKLYLDPPAPTVKNPRAYVFQMARNLALNALRRKPYSDPEPEQADVFSHIDLRLDLDAAISRLTDSQRQVLALHLNAGLTFWEIAGILGQSLPATYRIYRRALKVLRNILDGGFV